jgi:hypothetical protein
LKNLNFSLPLQKHPCLWTIYQIGKIQTAAFTLKLYIPNQENSLRQRKETFRSLPILSTVIHADKKYGTLLKRAAYHKYICCFCNGKSNQIEITVSDNGIARR